MKLLLLVQSEADVTHLEPAARAILNSAITGIWVVFSPAITVNASEAAAKLDGEIAGLKKAEREAAERSDYAAAAGYKTQREGKELDRMKEVTDAHKKLNAEEKSARVKTIFGPFINLLKPAGLNVKITGHSDHHPREQWVQMLNSLSGVWFKEFAPGQFLIAWPEAVETSIRALPTLAERLGPTSLDRTRINAGENMPLTPAEEKEVKAVVPQTRGQELAALHPMKLGPVMKGLGLDPEGLSRAEKIAAILAAEAKPETVDAY